LKTRLNTNLKRKKNEKIAFFESLEPEHREGLYKNGKFYTPPGLPADSRPTELVKKDGGETILTNRPLPTPHNRPNQNNSYREAPQNNNQEQLKCRALYKYDAQEADELTLRKGNIITIIKEHPDWWEGELNGKVGVFPANYVQRIGDDEVI